MSDLTTGNRILDFSLGAAALIGTIWTGLRFLIQPAYKIESLRQINKQQFETLQSYERRIDSMLAELKEERVANKLLREEMRDLSETTKRSNERCDMMLIYQAERMLWERRGRVSTPPHFPEELEAALYEVVGRIQVEAQEREAAKEPPPFFKAPEGGAN